MIWKPRFYIKGEKIEAAFSLVISEHYWGKEIGKETCLLQKKV